MTCRANRMNRSQKMGNTMPYVYTNPPPDTIIHDKDRAFAISREIPNESCLNECGEVQLARSYPLPRKRISESDF